MLVLDLFQLEWSKLERPLISEITAGFPSPAADFVDRTIDLNETFIPHPSATFFGKVRGNSMINAGIHDGDLLIIDRSLNPKNGAVAVCYIDGEYTLKRLKIEKECCWLIPENDAFQPIRVNEENTFLIWGIVAHTIHSF